MLIKLERIKHSNFNRKNKLNVGENVVSSDVKIIASRLDVSASAKTILKMCIFSNTLFAQSTLQISLGATDRVTFSVTALGSNIYLLI